MFITENVPSSLRGKLMKWMLQLKPGVFIGTLSALVGEKLWVKIQEKIGDGGAIWIKATNNEQRFKIRKSGKTNWRISDFDGLQLITHPLKKATKKRTKTQKITSKEEITNIIKVEKNTRTIPKVTWDTENTPVNFLTRKVSFKYQNSKIVSLFSGTSAYEEYPPEKLWEEPWIGEIKKISKSLLSYAINLENLQDALISNKILMCLDIETTDYIPKAYEGFVNIIGFALLDLKKNDLNNYNLQLFQVFNMTRKRENAPLLLKSINPYFKNVDTLLVFNRNFDITIISKIINENSLNIELPTNIVDLMDNFPNLKTLEKLLTEQVGVSRSKTNKDKYSEYYKLFKGKGNAGYGKKIEPIGTYNLTDTLTPLFMYLLLNSKKLD